MDKDGGDMLSVITRFPVSFEDWYFLIGRLIGCQLGLNDCFCAMVFRASLRAGMTLLFNLAFVNLILKSNFES